MEWWTRWLDDIEFKHKYDNDILRRTNLLLISKGKYFKLNVASYQAFLNSKNRV